MMRLRDQLGERPFTAQLLGRDGSLHAFGEPQNGSLHMGYTPKILQLVGVNDQPVDFTEICLLHIFGVQTVFKNSL